MLIPVNLSHCLSCVLVSPGSAWAGLLKVPTLQESAAPAPAKSLLLRHSRAEVYHLPGHWPARHGFTNISQRSKTTHWKLRLPTREARKLIVHLTSGLWGRNRASEILLITEVKSLSLFQYVALAGGSTPTVAEGWCNPLASVGAACALNCCRLQTCKAARNCSRSHGRLRAADEPAIPNCRFH